jgi:peptidoglycan/LPS O-acetylase OafA/YrhL
MSNGRQDIEVTATIENGPVEPNRIRGLDGMRAVSALGVMCFHYVDSMSGIIPDWMDRVMRRGMLGVEVFFVISGFLITRSLLRDESKSGSLELRDFYVKRAIRILPPAFAFLLVLLLLKNVFNILVPNFDFLSCAVFFRNWVDGAGLTAHYWSLSIEEQFYIMWPLLLLVVRTPKWRLLLTGCLLILGPVFRATHPFSIENPWATHVHCDGLLTGCALAQIMQRDISHRILPSWFVRSESVFILILLTYGALTTKQFEFAGCMQWVLIALMLVYVMGARQGVVDWLLNCRVVVWIGTISYSLYLWQQLFCGVHPLLTIFPINFLCAFTCAATSYYVVERPFMRLRKKLR